MTRPAVSDDQGATGDAALPRPAALQLYTLREEAATDFPSVLRYVAETGYRGVEPAGLHGHEPEEVRKMLDDLGLVVTSSHGPIPDSDEARRGLEAHVALGSPVIFPSLGSEWFSSRDQIERAADRMAAGAAATREAGLLLGYHNHYWEFRQSLTDASGEAVSAYDTFLDALRARGVEIHLEVDLYWVAVGGVDPARLLRQLGPAVSHVHVKDGPITVEDPMVAVGAGRMDIRSVLEANPAVRWHVVELDRSAGDMRTAVADSLAYLEGEGLSVGRRS